MRYTTSSHPLRAAPRTVPRRCRGIAARLATLVAVIFGLVCTGIPTAGAALPTPKPSSGASSDAKAQAAKDRATFGIGPATKGKPDVRPAFNFSSAGGGQFNDTVALLNFSSKSIELEVYTTNLTNAADGALSLKQGQTKFGTSTWIQLPDGLKKVSVPPSTPKGPGTVIVPFRLRVPFGSAPGDHGAGIVASLKTLGKNPEGQNVLLDQRIAARVFVKVRGNAREELTVQNVKVTYKPNSNPFGAGATHVRYLLRNSGNVNLGVKQSVSVTGLFGTKASAPPLRGIDLLLPGGTVWMDADVKGVFPTVWQTAHITATPFAQKGEPATTAKPVTRDVDFKAWPWTLLGLIILLLLLIVSALWWWLRRRGRPKTPTPAKLPKSPTDPAGDAAEGAADGAPGSTTPPAPETVSPAGRSFVRQVTRIVLTALVVFAAGVSAAPGAEADSVPYNDPSSIGRIGLCDKSGHPVTSGDINDRPFVWRAVSSVKAPKGYSVKYGSATLLAFQPQKKLPPQQWNGDTLTAASSYTNLNYPMAQATDQDFTLNDVLKVYPILWDGLVQLRMYFAAPEVGALNTAYPSTDIKVTGTKWKVIRGANVPCTKGDAMSSELLPTIGPNHILETPSGAAHASSSAKPSASAAPHSGGSTPAPTAAGTTDSNGTPAVASDSPVAASNRKDDGDTPWGAIVLVAVVVLALAGGGTLWLRGRLAGSSAANGDVSPGSQERPE